MSLINTRTRTLAEKQNKNQYILQNAKPYQRQKAGLRRVATRLIL